MLIFCWFEPATCEVNMSNHPQDIISSSTTINCTITYVEKLECAIHIHKKIFHILLKEKHNGKLTLQFSDNFFNYRKIWFHVNSVKIVLPFCAFFLPFPSDVNLYFFDHFFEIKIN